MKLLAISFLATVGLVSNSNAQSSTHTITNNGETTVISTVCFGTSCHTRISTRPVISEADRKASKAARKAHLQELAARCVEPKQLFGENLERFPDPINSDLASCIKNGKIRSWIIDQNYSKYLRGEIQTTRHPIPQQPTQ